jgi:tRNA/tmRNA/rRNA uracil-C5-methylase (TrmA/RlmC/RlmD family)
VGLDSAGPAIEAATSNARHLLPPGRARFLAAHLTHEVLARRLPRPGKEREVALLDPPRQGTAPGVIAALAERRPERVVHICCGTDELPRELGCWREYGYRTQRIIPLDLFPGSAGLETLVLLTPA